jgi:rhodanese-related sulfurtransferase
MFTNCKRLITLGAVIALMSSTVIAGDKIPFTSKNIMQHTKNSIVSIAKEKGFDVSLIPTKELDKMLETSSNDVMILAYNKGCEQETIKGAQCLKASTYKQISVAIEKNSGKKHYILLCNSGKQSLIYTALFKLSGVDIPDIIPASYKNYKKDGGKFVDKK